MPGAPCSWRTSSAKGAFGKLSPGAARSELFAVLPAGSIGIGIRFDRDGRM